MNHVTEKLAIDAIAWAIYFLECDDNKELMNEKKPTT
jgi:hypothetical protein